MPIASPAEANFSSSDNAGVEATPHRWLALDLDGTLIDAERRQTSLAADCLARLGGGELDRLAFWREKRTGAPTAHALRTLGVAQDLSEAVAALWGLEVEDERWLSLDAWLPGAVESLATAKEHGFGVVVVTARRDRKAVERQCERLGLLAIIDRLEVVEPRSAATGKARLIPSAYAMIGDSESDAEAASIAGVRFMGVASGVRSEEFLVARGCEVFATVLEAVSMLVEPMGEAMYSSSSRKVRP